MSFAQASGRLDLPYLAAALSRAGMPPPSGTLSTEPLLGGRTGTTVQRLTAGERSFVLKLIPGRSWRVVGMQLERAGEHWLWAHGVTRDLAAPVHCPVIDVAHELGEDRYWVLMHDLSDGIRGRGKFSRRDSFVLFSGIAAMHAAHFERPALVDAPLPSVTRPTELFRKAVLHLSGKRICDEAWVLELVDDFEVVGALLPLFLEQLGSTLADDFLSLAADDRWLDALGREPQTLLHGDLRRANIALQGDRIGLFDWELAARGPAGADLQWHCLLHYWAYPPDGVEPGDDCDDLALHYFRELETRLARPLDRAAFERGWKLGWIKAMVQIGYVLVDSIHSAGGDAAARDRVAALCRRAVRRALDMRASLPIER
jgi:hypothetical protein